MNKVDFDFNYYKILNILRTSSPQEIREAYRKMSKEVHPDVGGSNEQQINVNRAYEILSDPLLREQYDRGWNNLYGTSFTTPKTQKPSSEPRTTRTGNERPKEGNKSTIQQLFTRISKIFDQQINNLKTESEKWIKEKISSYEKKLLEWKREQETLFRQKMAVFEEKLNNLKQEQLRFFNQQVAKYDTLYLKNCRLRKKLFYTAVIFSEVALLSATLPFLSIILSLGEKVLILAVAGSAAIVVTTTFFWLWYISTRWVMIGVQRVELGDPQYQQKIKSILVEKQARQRLIVEGQEIPINIPDSMEKIRNILQSNLFSKKIDIGFHQISYNSSDWQKIIADIVNRESQEIFSKEEENIKTRREKFLRYATEISDLVGRKTTIDSSEEQVARRIAITFFMMGYFPLQYNNQARMFVFSDGDEKIVIRFRHRVGNPTNISFVKDMTRNMSINHAHKGFLFCTPGLSDNADKYAHANSITWYSLETMNEWIDNVLTSGYSGPTGDILQHTDKMVNFLRQITLSLKSR